jgi:hypothetical protein
VDIEMATDTGKSLSTCLRTADEERPRRRRGGGDEPLSDRSFMEQRGTGRREAGGVCGWCWRESGCGVVLVRSQQVFFVFCGSADRCGYIRDLFIPINRLSVCIFCLARVFSVRSSLQRGATAGSRGRGDVKTSQCLLSGLHRDMVVLLGGSVLNSPKSAAPNEV